MSGTENQFEINLRELGIVHIKSSPGHPQTCGKLERWHGTSRRWMERRPPPDTEAELQAEMDHWRRYYNDERPHRALNGKTPIEVWQATPPAQPGEPIDPEARVGLQLVDAGGRIGWGRYQIGVGQPYAGLRLLVVARGLDATVIGPEGIIRRLTIDPTRRYQPTGQPPGPKPRRR